MKRRRRRVLGSADRIACSTQKTSLVRVRLDRGGYDDSGRYFGRGEPLWSFDNRDSWGHLRAPTRAAAKAELRAKCPRIRFYR